MPKLTKQHFRWLAEDIAPLIQAGRGEHFAKLVQEFSQNSRFNKEKFLDVSGSHWNAHNPEYQHQEDIDDSIPYQETHYVIDRTAA